MNGGSGVSIGGLGFLGYLYHDFRSAMIRTQVV